MAPCPCLLALQVGRGEKARILDPRIKPFRSSGYGRGGHGSVYISKVSHLTFVWLVSKNLGHG